jgi:hypothetical protein
LFFADILEPQAKDPRIVPAQATISSITERAST